MEPRSTDSRSLQMGAGIFFLVVALIALIMGSLVVALILALIASGFFWATTRSPSHPTA